jgi:hypothetical protein
MGERGRAADALGLAAQRGEALAPVWFAYAEALVRRPPPGRGGLVALRHVGFAIGTHGGDGVRCRSSAPVGRQRIAAALAGPGPRCESSPPSLSGPFVAIAVGVSPGDLYTEAAGAMSLAVGLAVLLLGRLWRRSDDPGRHRRVAPSKRHGASGFRRWTSAQRSESS